MSSKLFFALSVLLTCLLCSSAAVAHDGPHGGELYCDGQHKHHAELVLNRKTGQALVYVLDSKGKKEVPIASSTIVMKVKGVEKDLQLSASNMTNGKASQFTVKHDRFTSKLKASDVTFEIVLGPGQPAVTFKPEHDDDD